MHHKHIMKREHAETVTRPPVIAVMGHIDHGKSTLLDYIRKTNVVDAEAGGITQHISAYEVIHKNKEGEEQKITFLDTPGHEAFCDMRIRGAVAADIAVLIVSAEDGVMPQTLEALSCVKESRIPYIVAINKIDRPNANIEKTKTSLLENEIYLEGLGGDVPFVPLSAKTGEGIPELLDTMLIVAELEELKGDTGAPAEGIVIESHLDPKKGTSAALIIKNGTLKSGAFVVAGESYSPVRIMEDFRGNALREATFSSPVRVIGFNALPPVGSTFITVKTKKEAEQKAFERTQKTESGAKSETQRNAGGRHKILPLIIKADAAGSLEAIEREIAKHTKENISVKILATGVGSITENDARMLAGSGDAVALGFNVGIDSAAADIAGRNGIELKTFSIIYELSEWFGSALEARAPRVRSEESNARATILKIFSRTKDKHVVGGRAEEGVLNLGAKINIIRKGTKIGTAKITNLQAQKANVQQVSAGNEFGAEINSPVELVAGDCVECFIVVEK